jgi:hypothetical protein
MFNPIQVVVDAFVEQLQKQYQQIYGMLEPANPGIIGFIARLAMENIANSDAPYHDMNHTIMVTLVRSGDPARQTHRGGRCHTTGLATFHNLSVVS